MAHWLIWERWCAATANPSGERRAASHLLRCCADAARRLRGRPHRAYRRDGRNGRRTRAAMVFMADSLPMNNYCGARQRPRRAHRPRRQRLFEAMPNELHCDLLGAVRRETLLSLAERGRLSARRIQAFYTRGGSRSAHCVLRALDEHGRTAPHSSHRLRIPGGCCRPHRPPRRVLLADRRTSRRLSPGIRGAGGAGVVIRDAAHDFGTAPVIPEHRSRGRSLRGGLETGS